MTASYQEGSWHSAIIAAHAAAVKSETGSLSYLEIGVRFADTFNKVLPFADRAVAVDLQDISQYLQGGDFHCQASDEFFATYDKEPFDLIFIDGLHEASQVEKDFNNALKVCSPNATIYLHDTWPVVAEKASSEFCGDVWKFAEQLEATYSKCFTFQQFPGLTLVQPEPKIRSL